MKARPDALAQIINSQWPDICDSYNAYQIRILNAIRRCRTPELGGSLYKCDHCGAEHFTFHSCRNRHCPQCQNTQQQKWIALQEAKLIHTKYFHVVFTIPQQLNDLFLAYQRQLYKALFDAAWQTLNDFGWNHKYLGAQLGATLVLHTWGANLSYHPHIHCIVPGGGVTLKGKWRNVKGGGKFLFPIKALSKVYKAKLISSITQFIKQQGMQLDKHFLDQLKRKPWVVYAKPASDSISVIKYLARYASKIAISHHRIIHFNQQEVSFYYTDYRHKNQKKIMVLSTHEFIRRFSLHFLPKGFCKIRHYGILSAAWKKKVFPNVEICVKTTQQIWSELGLDISKCNSCKIGNLTFIQDIKPSREIGRAHV